MSDGIAPLSKSDLVTETKHRRGRARGEALRSLIPHGEPVVYAIRLVDGVVKIGCTRNLPKRRAFYPGGEIIGFRFGDEDAERAVHARLRSSVARGREYYHLTPEVLAVVNEMREDFGLSPLIT